MITKPECNSDCECQGGFMCIKHQCKSRSCRSDGDCHRYGWGAKYIHFNFQQIAFGIEWKFHILTIDIAYIHISLFLTFIINEIQKPYVSISYDLLFWKYVLPQFNKWMPTKVYAYGIHNRILWVWITPILSRNRRRKYLQMSKVTLKSE